MSKKASRAHQATKGTLNLLQIALGKQFQCCAAKKGPSRIPLFPTKSWSKQERLIGYGGQDGNRKQEGRKSSGQNHPSIPIDPFREAPPLYNQQIKLKLIAKWELTRSCQEVESREGRESLNNVDGSHRGNGISASWQTAKWFAAEIPPAS